MVYVIRNNQQFGPYDEHTLLSYVNEGQVLLCDMVLDIKTQQTGSVRHYLKKARLKPRIKNAGNIFRQVKDTGSTLILPIGHTFNKMYWFSDKRLLMLSAIGLLPLLLGSVLHGWLMFYAISLYFASVWGLFFYYLFRTNQVRLKTTLLLFFATQISVFLIFVGLGLNRINPFYLLDPDNILLRIPFYICAVGVSEEFVKSIPLYIVERTTKQPLIPQTMVFYGLICGIAFGVFEGVQYQTTVNVDLSYSEGFMLNIARLTSLPFLHAIWCGIAGYFISFSVLYPKYRWSLRILALCIPAILHGVYDSFCSTSLFGLSFALFISIMGIVLLMVYLKQGVNMQSKLKS